MARIKFGSIVSDISGSIGGHTIQRNSYGSSIRTKPIPSRTGNMSQLSERSLMLQVVQSWRLLSLATQMNYDRFSSYSPDFAKNNSISKLSGYNLYLKWQNLYLRAFGTLASLSTYSTFNVPVITPTFMISGGYMTYNLNASPALSSVMCQVCMSDVITGPSTSLKVNTRFISSSLTNAGNVVFGATFINIYGHALSHGQQIVIKLTFFSVTCPIVYTPQLLLVTL